MVWILRNDPARAVNRYSYEFVGGRPSLFQVDLAENSARRLARPAQSDHTRYWLIDGAGQIGAALDRADDGKWQVLYGTTVLASGLNATGDVSLIAFGKEGNTVIYAVEDKSDNIVHLYEVPLAGGKSSEILADVEIDRFYVEPSSGRLLGYLQSGTPARPVLFDAARQSALTKVYRAFRTRYPAVVEWTPSFGNMLVRTTGKGDPGTWYLVDIANLKAVPVGDERPSLQSEQVGDISMFAYKASDGMDLDGVLTLPAGRIAQNLPLILLPHGGPTAHDEPGFDWWAQAMASRGYAVFQPNFRGSTNRDDAFRRAGYGQWGRKMQTDVSDAIPALAAKGIVDPKRVCIVGASYGRYAALAGVTLQQGVYRCAVAVAGVSDLSELQRIEMDESNSSRMVRASLRETLGPASGFDAVSPRRNAARANAPVLLIHGKDDTVVPFHHSTAMQDALRDAGKPVEMVVLREEDHWLSRSATRQQMLEATLGFVMKHNPAD